MNIVYLLADTRTYFDKGDTTSLPLRNVPFQEFLSFNNPIIISLLLVIVVWTVSFIYYRFILLPMTVKHIKEQKSLEEQNARLMALFTELDPEPVFRFNAQGEIIMTNSAGTRLLEAIAPGQTQIRNVVTKLANTDLAAIITAGEQREIIEINNGRHIQFTIRGVPDLNFGQIYGNDITELILAEEKVRTALVKAEESEMLKTHFLSQMSHEIRSPMNTILGISSLLYDELSGKVPEDLIPLFKTIQSSGKRLYRTLDLNLHMALVLTGGMKLYPKYISITAALHSTILEYRSYAKDKGLSFTFTDSTTNNLIYADEDALRLIIGNLLDNAVKYTKEGSVTVVVENSRNDGLFITISDTGIGISDEYLKKLFIPYTQEVMGYGRPYEGNGLGLALVHKLVELHNAVLSISSEKNKGTTVTLAFDKNLQGQHKTK